MKNANKLEAQEEEGEVSWQEDGAKSGKSSPRKSQCFKADVRAEEGHSCSLRLSGRESPP